MKGVADKTFGPSPAHQDGNYERGLHLRRARGWVGIGAAVLAYLIWNNGRDVGEALVEAAAIGPVMGFLKLGLCTIAGMLLTLVVVRGGQRFATFKQFRWPFGLIVALGLLMFLAFKTLAGGWLSGLDWGPAQWVLALISGLLFPILLMTIFFIFLPTGLEHCFRARDGHIILAPLAFISYGVWLMVESTLKLAGNDLPENLPAPVGITFLLLGPLTMIGLSIWEMVALDRSGMDLRSAELHNGSTDHLLQEYGQFPG